MTAYAGLKIKYNPSTTYSGNSQNNVLGATAATGVRGVPAFTDPTCYHINKTTGNDSNAGTAAAPKKNLGSLFQFAGSTFDYSGNSNNLGVTGGVNLTGYPCRPVPPAGCSVIAGPFTDSNYFTLGSPGALTGKTAWCVEGWFYAENLGGNTIPWAFTDGAVHELSMNSDGSLSFFVNGSATSSAAGIITKGKWFYIACSFSSGATGGKQIFCGTSPETATLVAQGTQTHTLGIVTGFSIGTPVSPSGYYFNGYIGRIVISSAVRTSFPTNGGTSNIIALYTFTTQPLAQSAPKTYISIDDSSTYNEAVFAPWQYDMSLTSAYGLYAADGQAPTFQLSRGAILGTYGPNNSARNVTGTPNYYINQTTGNDGTGARNNPAKPFKTISGALANGAVTAADDFQVTDSAIYIENLTLPNVGLGGFTLRAANGQTPTLRPLNLGIVHVTSPNLTNGTTFDGFVMDGNNTSQSLLGGTAGAFITLANCSVRYYNTIFGNGFSGSINNCIVSRCATIQGGSSNLTALNTLFDYAPLGTILFPIVLGYGVANLTQCTFNNCAVTYTGNGTFSVWDQCKFYNCTVAIANSINNQNYNFTNILFDKTSFSYTLNSGAAPTIALCFINCFQRANGSTLAYGFNFTNSNTGIVAVWMQSCGAVGNARNFYFNGTGAFTNSYLTNCTSASATTAGYDAPATVNGNALVSSGDVVAWQTGITPVLSESGATILSSSPGAENVTLSASDAGIFGGGGQGYLDMGMDWAAWNLTTPMVIINGITFSGLANGEAAIRSTANFPLTLQYCTFSGLGTYGASVSDGAAVSNCVFNTNGHAVKFNRSSMTLSNCLGNSCGGAFTLNFGQYLTSNHNTAYNCQYGQYDASGSAVSVISNSIFSSSGAYDYHGAATALYSCVGTLDPSTLGSLGTGCTVLDPLFQNASTNTAAGLEIQTQAYGYFYDSPCKAAASDGKDMGAWDFTYGTGVVSYGGTIDFSTPGYRNPDVVLRKIIPIKLAEGDQEDGSIYSTVATFKKEYEFTWNPNSNDMPLTQLAALLAMYTASSNQLMVDFGEGAGYVAHYLARSPGFEYTEMTGGYADDTTPEPLRAATIREA